MRKSSARRSVSGMKKMSSLGRDKREEHGLMMQGVDAIQK
jgi:hypothetical protein